MAGPEAKLWQFVKKNFQDITWTRIENSTSLGTPDLLGYNKNNHFFTVELKVTKTNKVRFSPHQISFHVRHPKNSFIIVQVHDPCCLKLYEGHRSLALDAWCLDLVACGLALEPPTSSQVPWILNWLAVLVFTICHVCYVSVPACAAALTLIILFRCRARGPSGYYSRSPGPEFHWSLVDHMRGHTNY